MLIKANALKGYSLKSLDGDIGSAREFYFDDQYWAIRYLVANTATWLSGRKVLLSPYSLDGIDTAEEKVFVLLNRKQIEESPSIDTDEPVSRQFERLYNGYYGYPDYWGGPYMWGGYSCLSRDRTRWGSAAPEAMRGDRHLRSTHEVTGYHLLASDGEIGHVVDFIIDDETWGNSLPCCGNKELVAWEEGSDFAKVDRERELGRERGCNRPVPRGHQGCAGIYRRISAHTGLRNRSVWTLQS